MDSPNENKKKGPNSSDKSGIGIEIHNQPVIHHEHDKAISDIKELWKTTSTGAPTSPTSKDTKTSENIETSQIEQGINPIEPVIPKTPSSQTEIIVERTKKLVKETEELVENTKKRTQETKKLAEETYQRISPTTPAIEKTETSNAINPFLTFSPSESVEGTAFSEWLNLQISSESNIKNQGINVILNTINEFFSSNTSIDSLVAPHLGLDLRVLPREHTPFHLLISYHNAQLNSLTPAIFNYYTEEEKQTLRIQLLHHFAVYSIQHKIVTLQGRKEQIKAFADKIQQCCDLLSKLELTTVEVKAPSESVLTRYCGLNQLNSLLNIPRAAVSSLSDTVKTRANAASIDFMSALNNKRLFWVWTGSFLDMLLLFINGGDVNSQAYRAVHAPDDHWSRMSFILYFLRLFFNVGMVVKHVIFPNGEDKNISRLARFKSAFATRRNSIINDSQWGITNLLCAVWLKGNGILGKMGNVLTAIMLLMDAIMSIINYIEFIRVTENELSILNRKISASASSTKTEKDTLQKYLAKRQKEIALEKRLKIIEMGYSFVLCASFTAFSIAAFFSGPASAIALTVAMGMCMLSTILFEAYTIYSEVQTLDLELQTLRDQVEAYTTQLIDAIAKNANEDPKNPEIIKLLSLIQHNALKLTSHAFNKKIGMTKTLIATASKLIFPLSLMLVFLLGASVMPFWANALILLAITLLIGIVNHILEKINKPVSELSVITDERKTAALAKINEHLKSEPSSKKKTNSENVEAEPLIAVPSVANASQSENIAGLLAKTLTSFFQGNTSAGTATVVSLEKKNQ
jgi:hypothetical protein